MDEPRLHKVAILVTRAGADGSQLLVFEHDHSGVQAPAGSVEPGEDIKAAAIRELAEETGVVVDDLELLTSFRNDSKPDELYCVEYVALRDRPSDDATVVLDHVYRLPLRVLGEVDAWTEVALIEWDLNVDPPTEISRVQGFVPTAALADWEMRHVFWCPAPDDLPETWEQQEESLVLRCRWAPLDDAGLLFWQQDWIDRVRDRLPK